MSWHLSRNVIEISLKIFDYTVKKITQQITVFHSYADILPTHFVTQRIGNYVCEITKIVPFVQMGHIIYRKAKHIHAHNTEHHNNKNRMKTKRAINFT